MPREIVMPQLGMTQDSGRIVAWRKAPGDAVAPDDVLMEVETDKATMEVPAGVAGVLAEVRTPEGAEAAVGAVVAVVAETGEPAAAPRAAPPPQDSAAEAPETTVAAAGAPPAPAPQTVRPALAAVPQGRVLASPKARRLARERGLDLGDLVRDGVREPVRAADLDRLPDTAGTADPWDVDHGAWGPVTATPVPSSRRVAARRLAAIRDTAVAVTRHDRADMSGIEAVRARLLPEAERRGVTLGALAFHIKALAATLARHPVFNASLSPDGATLWLKGYVHIGVVADTGDGVLVPVIRDVDRKGILAVASEIADLAARARARRLRPGETGGGSMSVESPGHGGGTGFAPVINAPEAAILAIGRTGTAPAPDGGVPRSRPTVALDLTCDRRIVTGAEAARFMADYRGFVEEPARLLL